MRTKPESIPDLGEVTKRDLEVVISTVTANPGITRGALAASLGLSTRRVRFIAANSGGRIVSAQGLRGYHLGNDPIIRRQAAARLRRAALSLLQRADKLESIV